MVLLLLLLPFKMSIPWTHLVRFVAVEDNQIHLGQLVDTGRDAGKDSAAGVENSSETHQWL